MKITGKRKIVVLFAAKELSDVEVPKQGTLLDAGSYDQVIKAEDSNLKPGDAVMVHKPGAEQPFGLAELEDETSDDPEERLLFCLIHNAIPQSICVDVAPVLRKAASNLVAGGNRNVAAGAPRVAQLKKDGSRSKVQATPKIDDPLLASDDRARLRGAKEGVIGALGPGVRGGVVYGTRFSQFTKQHPEEMQRLKPLVKAVNKAFRMHADQPYDNQLGAAIQSMPWLLGRPDLFSVFTTATTNLSWQTAAHRDKGNFKKGLGVICCFGNFAGCYLVFPKFRIAIKFEEGDILLADVNEVHGNTVLLFPDGAPASEFNKPERLSCVFYFVDKILKK